MSPVDEGTQSIQQSKNVWNRVKIFIGVNQSLINLFNESFVEKKLMGFNWFFLKV